MTTSSPIDPRAIDRARPPLVLHVIHRFAVGGLENGLVNLLNAMPADRYRHAIVCLTGATEFRARLVRDDVQIVELHKRPGQDLGVHARLWKVLRSLRPDIVHTRSFPTLECLVTAAAAGVRARIHGEHGRDIYDLDGVRWKYHLVRRAVRPLVHRYVAVSRELQDWLVQTVGARPARVTRVCNGVDVERFRPAQSARTALGPPGFLPPGALVVGSVGRMEPVKDPVTLVRAFVDVVKQAPDARSRLRLVMIGDGSLSQSARDVLHAAGVADLAWLPGERSDVVDLMRAFDLFVLPSLREGISNTILEAMASGLPVIATRVGGNGELVDDGETGTLVPADDPAALAEAILRYAAGPELLRRHGTAGRAKTETALSIDAMMRGYLAVYDSVLAETRGAVAGRRWGSAILGGVR